MKALGSKPRGRITRWLRFRLTLGFVLFFALLLAAVGFIFRGILGAIQNDQVSALLEEEWAAIRGYLVIDPAPNGSFRAVWRFDREDPEAALIVERLRSVFLIADADGRIMESSESYRSLGLDGPAELRSAVAANRVSLGMREAPDGTPYMIRSGVIIDAKKPFFIAIGKSMQKEYMLLNRFTTYYFATLPLIILACSVLGWLVSKRALKPVRDLAASTEAVSGSNLSLRIPQRGAGDELDDLIATFNKMVERLERSFNQTRQFSTDVSHELRTPLTVIRGQLEVALMTARSEENYRDAIMAALHDVERLSHTVRALLHLSQAEGGQVTLQLTKIDLAEIVSDIVEQYRLLAESEDLILQADTSVSCIVSGDRVQLERLLTNLLSNAIKYTPPGGQIRVTVGRKESQAELIVEDTGRGIPPEALPHIFNRYYRVKERKDDPAKGLGLGLSFVAWIVRAHDGSIDVQSTVGRGTTFTVRLPAVQNAERKRPTEVKEAYGV